MTEEIQTQQRIRLQCPECLHPLGMSNRTYFCPLGHVELNITNEGYPILKDLNNSIKPLLYGGDFPEGHRWEKILHRCEKAVYVTEEEGGEEDLRPLQHHLMARSKKLLASHYRELRKLKLEKGTPIIIDHRIRRMNRWIIMLRYLRHPIYIYIPGMVLRANLVRVIKQKLGVMLHKYFILPIVSKSVEARYNQYLYDETAAKEFASNYLPESLRNGKGQQVFDIGCGRGRHAAILNQLGYSVTGLDLQSHPYWARIPQASFMVGTTDCLSFIPEDVFDLVICIQVLMYLVDDGTALAHIRRILKRGGTLLLQVTNGENLHTVITKQSLAEDPYLQRYYKQSELCNKLVQRHFIIDRVWTEKIYIPFLVLPGNILYEFILSQSLKRFWDKLAPSQNLGLINILARAV